MSGLRDALPPGGGTLAVVDYGAGNLQSVANALDRLGASYVVTPDPAVVDRAGAVIFPGVGEAAAAMSVLRRTGLDAALARAVAAGKKTLGICIGCQVIFERSEERNTDCLGILPGVVRRFPPAHGGLKVPHMGWNPVRQLAPHPVFAGIPQGTSFYFVHSYYPAPARVEQVVADCEHGIAFPAAVAAGSLLAFQFHVEKSGPAGLALLGNFLRWDGRWDGRGEAARA